MTTKILTGTYSAGYSFGPPITTLSIAASGYVEGRGVQGSGEATVVNHGRIVAADSPGSFGVYLAAGGAVTNGGPAHTNALIEGYAGVAIASGPGTVRNFGTIDGLSTKGYSSVYLGEGGAVTNGSAADTTALIEGSSYVGVTVLNAAGAMTNFGTISSGEIAVELFAGGELTNGSNKDTGALIEAQTGVYFGVGSGTVGNFGTIDATGAIDAGVDLKVGGIVTNGSRADTTALIEGPQGAAVVAYGVATIVNFGSMTGGKGALVLLSGGAVTNGDAADTTALMVGGEDGVVFDMGGAIRNFGTIEGLGTLASFDFGVLLEGGDLINGGRADTKALIEGVDGIAVPFDSMATVANFGTIAGLGGPGQPPVAVEFLSLGDRLVVEAGCSFEGAVLGGGGTLDLASGTGKLTGLLAGGDVTVSGSMARTTFTDFATVVIGLGARFTTSGAVTIAAGQTVTDSGLLDLGVATGGITNAGLIETAGAGSLTVAGALDNTGTIAADGGTLTVNGAVTGAGVAAIEGGTLDLASSFTQNVAFTGAAGVLELGLSQDYAGTVTGFSRSGETSLDLADIGFVSSAEATFSGAKSGGVLTVTDGIHTATISLAGDYLKSTFVASDDGDGGVAIVDLPSSAASVHQFIAAMAGEEGPAGGPIHAMEARSAHEPVLTKPRAMMA